MKARFESGPGRGLENTHFDLADSVPGESSGSSSAMPRSPELAGLAARERTIVAEASQLAPRQAISLARPRTASFVATHAATDKPHVNVSRLQGAVKVSEFELPAGIDVRATVFVDGTVQDVGAKKKAIHDALAMLQSRCPDLLKSIGELLIYLGKEVSCEATWTPDRPGGKLALYLGDDMFKRNNVDPKEIEGMKAISKGVALKPGEKPLTKDNARIWANGESGSRGVPDQAYDDRRKLLIHPRRIAQGKEEYQASKVGAKAAAVVVHELGHILHERTGGQKFWDSRKLSESPVSFSVAQHVSSYTQNKQPTELVAEVFTGLAHGKTYPEEVMFEYTKHGGPPVQQDLKAGQALTNAP